MSKEEYSRVREHLGIVIDYSRDVDIPEQGLALLTGKGFYKKPHENSPQESFARAATCYSFGDYDFAQRIYDYASKGWFTFASPVLSNAEEVEWPTFTKEEFEEAGDWLEENVSPDGLPISCYLSMIPDTKEGLVETRKETSWLSMMGGGIGIYAANRSPDEKSTGVMAHLRGYDADTLSYKQKESRRGSIAAYLDIDHPEILNFISMRNPIGGDQNKKCFNLNNAVNITDAFMKAVINGEEYELIDPKHGKTGKFLKARDVWELILETRYETGEPYIMFKDTVNRNLPEWITHPMYHVSQSNLCVSPDTPILTKSGYIPIGELENQIVEVWNGEEWSETKVVKTGVNQSVLKVVTSSGQEIECTPYHKFYVQESYNGKPVEKRAFELVKGDKLIKFELPIIQGNKKLHKAYQNGFYSGDGCNVKGRSRIYLYGDKKKLIDKFNLTSITDQTNLDRICGYEEGLKDKFFVPTSEYTIDSRLSWLAGIADSDGTIARNGTNESLQISSIHKEFLKEIQLMLQTLGVTSKVTKCHDAGDRELPLNNGTGDKGLFSCKDTYRLLISSSGLYKLSLLGFKPERLVYSQRLPQRCAEQFIKIEEVIDEGKITDTYCFTENKRGMGMFGGILTGQCSEITLRTSPTRSAVCCLSSVNLEKFDEWKDTNMVRDLIRMLDNVLEYFIRLAPPDLKRAVNSASKERAIGLGSLGWHSYLQSKMIPFESGGFNSAIQHTHQIFSYIKSEAIAESKQLAKERGECYDCLGSGMRNSHLLAIAPNASSSSMVGASPSIEPWNANAFNAQGRAGSFLIKNKYLEKILEEKGKNTKEVWADIIQKEGSVQHLDFLSEEEKKVFKTATEINQMWIIEQAAERQKYVCQAMSLNIFVPNDITLQEMSDLHIAAWVKGVKTLYYCRSKPATRANIGKGDNMPLNSVPVRTKIEFDETTCLSCEG